MKRLAASLSLGILWWPCSAEKAAAPASPDLGAHRLHATALLKRVRNGAVKLVNPGRDLPQIQDAALNGKFGSVVFSLRLLQTLDRLSARSSARNPLLILSLYRANSKAHSAGIAADIAGYGASVIDSRKTGFGLPAILMIIKVLGPGEYALGFPKPPNSDPVPLLSPPVTPPHWPYFPAPLPRLVRAGGKFVVAPKVVAGKMTSGGGRLDPDILRWANERGAPAADLQSPELRIALAEAERRGVRFRALFPDAVDHLHLEAY